MARHLLIEDVHPGFRITIRREVGEEDVAASVAFARDYGGYHVDEAFARAAGFRTLITSGIYHLSLIAELGGRFNLLGRELTVRLAGPIYAGDSLTGTAEVVEVVPEKRRVTLDIGVVNQQGGEVVAARLTGYLPAAEWGVPRRPGARAEGD